MKLWQQKESDQDETTAAVESFTVGNDFQTDKFLVPWDCYGSAAHAMGLQRIGLLTQEECTALKGGLAEIVKLHGAGKFEIAVGDEDCHTAIENFLIAKCGETGKKIHAGRSRNDQVLTAIKLYSKNGIFEVMLRAADLATELLTFADKHDVPFPGYTHMQKAMPSTVKLWAASFAELILDSSRLLRSVYELVDSSPLGSAAGYGVTFPLDRKYTADLLGFSRVQENVIAVQSSRGKNESAILSGLSLIMLDLGKLGADLIFFSQPELGYFRIPERFCTGSSIMPQKRNPDVLELLRAKAKVVNSLHMQVISIATDLPSGYNRDMQLTKEPLISAFGIVTASLTILKALIRDLEVDKKRCQAALTPDVYAADRANDLVGQGVSFRDAYRKVKDEMVSLKIEDPLSYINRKTHLGAPGNAGIQSLSQNVKALASQVTRDYSAFKNKLLMLF